MWWLRLAFAASLSTLISAERNRLGKGSAAAAETRSYREVNVLPDVDSEVSVCHHCQKSAERYLPMNEHSLSRHIGQNVIKVVPLTRPLSIFAVREPN